MRGRPSSHTGSPRSASPRARSSRRCSRTASRQPSSASASPAAARYTHRSTRRCAGAGSRTRSTSPAPSCSCSTRSWRRRSPRSPAAARACGAWSCSVMRTAPPRRCPGSTCCRSPRCWAGPAERLRGAPPSTISPSCCSRRVRRGARRAACSRTVTSCARPSCWCEHFGLRADDVLYCPFPLFHLDALVLTVMPALVLGATAAIGTRFSASGFWDELRAFGATVFDFMGATLTILHKQPPAPGDADNPARLAWGVPVPEWARRVRGPLRVAPRRALRLDRRRRPDLQPLHEPRRAGSCGRAIDAYDVRLVDAAGDGAARRGRRDRGPPARAVADLRRLLRHAGGDASRASRNCWFHTGDLARPTPTATSTSSAARPTRSAAAARTSPRSRSRRSCSAASRRARRGGVRRRRASSARRT